MTTRPRWPGALLCAIFAVTLSACDVDSLLGPSEVSIPAKAPRQLINDMGGIITLTNTSRIDFQVYPDQAPTLMDLPIVDVIMEVCTLGPGEWDAPPYTFTTDLDVGQIDGVYTPIQNILSSEVPAQLTAVFTMGIPYLGPDPDNRMTVGALGIYYRFGGTVTAEVRNLVNGQWVQDPATVRTMPFSYRMFNYEPGLRFCEP